MIGSTLRRGLDSVRHVAQPRGTLLARDTASGNYEMCETLVSEREHSPDLGWLRSLARVGTVLARWFAALAPARCRWMRSVVPSGPRLDVRWVVRIAQLARHALRRAWTCPLAMGPSPWSLSMDLAYPPAVVAARASFGHGADLESHHSQHERGDGEDHRDRK